MRLRAGFPAELRSPRRSAYAGSPGDRCDVLAVDEDAAAFRLEEAQEQFDQGRLASAGRPTKIIIFGLEST